MHYHKGKDRLWASAGAAIDTLARVLPTQETETECHRGKKNDEFPKKQVV